MATRKISSKPPVQSLLPVRPPLRVLILFALGQLGWSLSSFAAGNLLVYFYMPPEQGQPLFPAFLYQGPVLLFFTLIGLLSAGGRILDGFVDPLVANWSDRKRARWGKRRWFMLRSAVPFAVFGALVFFPPTAGEAASNFIWLMAVIALYYFSFACYVIPYNALMAELGHSAQERLKISTIVAMAWALGFVSGNSAYALQGYFEQSGKTPIEAFQTSVLCLQGLGLLCMLAPAIFLNEARYARQTESSHSLLPALKIVFKNRGFRWFLGSFLLYWLALTFIQLGIGFYTTLLLHLDKSKAFVFSLVGFASSILIYFPVNLLTVKWGKRRMMIIAYVIFACVFLATAFSAHIPIRAEWLLFILAIASSPPLAIFGILPNAIVGDAAEKAEQAEGQALTGMFFGLTAFTMKLGISLANLVFPSLLLFGRSAENPAGVQLTALAAFFFCLAGLWAFRKSA